MQKKRKAKKAAWRHQQDAVHHQVFQRTVQDACGAQQDTQHGRLQAVGSGKLTTKTARFSAGSSFLAMLGLLLGIHLLSGSPV
jgi:hypothetical protein